MTQHVAHRGSDPEGQVFARRGERVTTDHGTEGRMAVAIVKRDLLRHTKTSPDDFAWIIAKPKKGDDMNATPGFRTLPDGRPQVCIEGEWRPVLRAEGG